MISAIPADPLLIASSAFANSRHRPTTGERSLLPDSPVPVLKSSTASENGLFPRKEQDAAPQKQPEEERYGAASMFAAAVIAGSLPPAPTSIEELIMRIGSIPVPPESEARIKDLLA